MTGGCGSASSASRCATSGGWLASAQRAEELGFSTFLLRDHFIADAFGPQFAPVPALMTIANRTTSLRIGSLVFDNDYRHPVLLAQEVATLDLLSGGRFELGIGAGWLRDEYEQAGMTFDAPGTRVSRLEESLHVVKGLLTSEPFTFTGEYYQIAGLQAFPQSAQRPHPPILIGAGSKRMLEMAGREADIVNILPKALPAGAISEDATERLANDHRAEDRADTTGGGGALRRHRTEPLRHHPPDR